MARIRLLHRIHRQGADRVDAKLVEPALAFGAVGGMSASGVWLAKICSGHRLTL
jgi:hypothetical protein